MNEPNIGPHLLGRIPSKPDPRNYQLETFLSSDPLDIALANLLSSKGVAKGTKEWANFVTPYLKHIVIPPPLPPSGSKEWENPEPVLDQGFTGHCVGFGGAQWGNTLPVDDKFGNGDGHSIYYDCKIEDGEPREENGSTVHSLAKVLKNRGRINLYAFASTLDAIKTFIINSGPIIVGTDWYSDMFNPVNGFITPTGSIQGGHCYLMTGYDESEDAFLFLNSWGDSWGLSGKFKIKSSDFELLLNAQGEALAAVEL